MASDTYTTPQVDVELATLKTPDIEDKRSMLASEHRRSSSLRNHCFLSPRNVLQGLIFGAMLMYAYGQLFYFTKASDGFKTTIETWYNLPAASDNKALGRPTFFFLVCFVPIAISVALFEVLRHFNVHRITSSRFLCISRVLRRQPRVFGRVVRLSLGELLFLAFLLGGNAYVFYSYYLKRVEKSRAKNLDLTLPLYLKMISHTLGFNCIFNMAFLFLPATRTCVWLEVLNISYANGIKYHRWLGVMTIVTALCHCLGFYSSWLIQGEWQAKALPCFDCDIGEDEGHDRWMNFFGQMALLAFLAIGLTSIPWVRRHRFNTFYSVHHLFLVGTIFAVLHWKSVLAWLFPSLLLYTIGRTLSNSNTFTPVAVRDVTRLSHDVVKVVLCRSTDPRSRYQIGQFLYLNVPAISRLQWHAFTIASSPRSSPDTLTILLKAAGDWTRHLVMYLEGCEKNAILPTLYMDGYYGASLDMYNEYSTVCLVGGGIGVTPLLAILEDLVAKAHKGEPLRQKVILIFSFRELVLLEELYPLLVQMKDVDPSQQYFCLHLYLTRTPTSTELNEAIDYQRLSGKSHVTATQYFTTKVPRPFRPSVYTCTAKVAVFSASCFLTLFVVVFVKLNNKVQGHDKGLWPLQNFTEIALLYAVSLLVVYTVVALTRRSDDPEPTMSQTYDMVDTPCLLSIAADSHTFQSLLAEYSVQVGHRANVPELMKLAFVQHVAFRKEHCFSSIDGNATVGVFVSGPQDLKRSVGNAVADIGTHHFDVHEEEFEL